MTKEEMLDHIDKKTNSMQKLGIALNRISDKIEPFDLFYISIINRTVNLNSAFTLLMRNNNFIAAAPLVRINLDSVLRMYASNISVFNRNEFATKVIGGMPINKIKSRESSKQLLSDRFLVNEISKVKNMEWVNQIYNTGNSFVHFSDNLIFSSQKIQNFEDRIIHTTIGIHDNFIEENDKFNLCFWMNEIIEAINIQCQLWLLEKCKKYNFNFDDLNKV
nr:hypothetical protein [uncultured Flavobacterium sp.]